MLTGCDRAGDEPAAVVFDGQALFSTNCVNCHGAFGEGDGVVTPSLTVVLQDLRYLSERNGGTFPKDFVTRIVDGRETRVMHGPEGMPVWGDVFASTEGYGDEGDSRAAAKVAAIVAFLESIQVSEPK